MSHTTIRPCSEVDPHHDTTLRRMADLGESGSLEDVAAARVELLQQGELLPRHGEHRVALERSGAAVSGEVDRRAHERTADAPLSKSGTREDARHRPHAVVGLVFVPALP